MAEIALASSVAGLLSLAIQVADISHRYFSSVKHSSKSIKGYFRELDILKLVLMKFDDLAKDPTTAAHISSVNSTIVDGCRGELESLRSKLQKRRQDSPFSKSLNRLTWPFVEDETQRIVDLLHRYQASFHAALSADHFRLDAGISAAITESVKHDAQDEIRTLANWLSPTDPASNHITAREKHGSMTGHWFLESDTFNKWCRAETKTIWLYGIPGAGKTILCSTIIEHLLYHRQTNDAVVYFYFDYGDEQKQNLESTIRSFIFQLCSVHGEVPEEVKPVIAIARELSGKGVLSSCELIRIFEVCCKRFNKIQIIMDALDECPESAPVLHFLKQVVENAGSKVQWLVSSRLERDIEDALLLLVTDTMSLDNENVAADIRRHVRSTLEHDWKLKSRPAKVKSRIEDVLTQKARGMFRWVECQLNVLRGCLTSPAVERALSALPETLDETYNRILLAIDMQYLEHARSAFEFLVVARRPLKVEELAEAVVIVPYCKAFDIDDRFFDPKDIISICGGLIVRQEETNEVRFAHYSVQEYLLSSRISRNFALSLLDAHRTVADACLTYLLSFDRPDSTYKGMMDDYPFLDYAICHWHGHAYLNVQDSSPRLPSLCATFFNVERNHAFVNWLSMFEHDLYVNWTCGNKSEQPIKAMMVMGRPHIAHALLPEWKSQHIHGHSCGPVLSLATRTSNIRVLESALELGCDVNGASAEYPMPLKIAAYQGDVEMVQTILRAGADVNSSVLELNSMLHFPVITALHAAVANSRPDVVRILLAAGANIHTIEHMDGITRSLLAVAIRDGPAERAVLEIVQLLLVHGADINEANELDGTPLHAALEEGRSAIARHLLDAGADTSVIAGPFATTLQAAAYGADQELVARLIQFSAGVNDTGGIFGTALQAAVYKSRADIVQYLVQMGADVTLTAVMFQDDLSWLLHHRREQHCLRISTVQNSEPFSEMVARHQEKLRMDYRTRTA